jgi:hypothetical protein
LDLNTNGIADYLDVVDPNLDSDHDGMPDAWERCYALDPFDASDAALDLDGDGLTNLQECNLGTDPTKRDSDCDGMDDAWEVLCGAKSILREKLVGIG